MATTQHIAIIGGGAAGFFSALSVKEHYPDAKVSIFEKSGKLLTKVKVSGGGRCNVTHAETSLSKFAQQYPRGKQFLKKCFAQFNAQDTIKWFEEKGVRLVAEGDGRMFPFTHNSQTIIDCFLKECATHAIEIYTQKEVLGLTFTPGVQVHLHMKGQEGQVFDKAILCTGGYAKAEKYQWIEKLETAIEPPIPSLFTFNMPSDPIKELMGVVAPNAMASIQGEKLKSQGPLLITHWGMSGPAILKLSAFGAELLHQKNYHFTSLINWVGIKQSEQVLNRCKDCQDKHPKKKLENLNPFDVPNRLWCYLIEKAGLSTQKNWGELGSKQLNKLVEILCRDAYPVKGKTTFKEEFVTCGGVSLDQINPSTMAHKTMKNIYFAGEVLNIDGVTGGYNFQSCWTTGYIAGKLKK